MGVSVGKEIVVMSTQICIKKLQEKHGKPVTCRCPKCARERAKKENNVKKGDE